MSNINNFNLIENAKESLEHAVGHLTTKSTPSPRDLKRAVLDVTHVIELLLKERLQRIHPAFIWEDVDLYPDESKSTVNTFAAVKRLKNIAGIEITEESFTTITEARKLRNKIEHFKFKLVDKVVQTIIGRLLSFIFDFSKKQLGLDWESEFRADGKWEILVSDYDFWKAHKLIIEKKMIDEHRDVVNCPECFALTFDLDLGECQICSFKDEVKECDSCGEQLPGSEFAIKSPREEPDVNICGNCFERHMRD